METTTNTTVDFSELITMDNRFEFVLIGEASLMIVDHKHGTQTIESLISGMVCDAAQD